MQLPKKVQRGQAITADWANSMVDYVHSITPKNGVGVKVSQTANGTTFSASRSYGSADSKRFPLTTYVAGYKNNNIILRIEAGTVSGIEPKIGSYEISNKNATLEVSRVSSTFIFLHLSYSDVYDSTPSDIEVTLSSTDLSINDYEISAYIKLGKIIQGEVINYLSSSLDSYFCSPNLLYWKV